MCRFFSISTNFKWIFLNRQGQCSIFSVSIFVCVAIQFKTVHSFMCFHFIQHVLMCHVSCAAHRLGTTAMTFLGTKNSKYWLLIFVFLKRKQLYDFHSRNNKNSFLSMWKRKFLDEKKKLWQIFTLRKITSNEFYVSIKTTPCAHLK